MVLAESPHQSSATTSRRHDPGTARARSNNDGGTVARAEFSSQVSRRARARERNSEKERPRWYNWVKLSEETVSEQYPGPANPNASKAERIMLEKSRPGLGATSLEPGADRAWICDQLPVPPVPIAATIAGVPPVPVIPILPVAPAIPALVAVVGAAIEPTPPLE